MDFAAQLLQLAQQLFEPAPPGPPPGCAQAAPLTADTLAALEDTLARGVMQFLAREGWRRERFLRAGQPVTGSLWERTPPQDAVFSRHTLRLLTWLAAPGPAALELPARHLRSGDHLIGFLAYRRFRGTELAPRLRGVLRANGLCRLMFADDFGPDPLAPQWSSWLSGFGASVLESVQLALEHRWMEMERGKADIASAETMRRLGHGQEIVLRSFSQAVHDAGRRDLARFLLRAADQLLADQPDSARWVGSLRLKGLPLAERVATQEAALALLRHLEIMQVWEREARTLSFLDDGYPAARLWKSDWDRCRGDALCDQARRMIHQVISFTPAHAG